jgi:hypothetical protein
VTVVTGPKVVAVVPAVVGTVVADVVAVVVPVATVEDVDEPAVVELEELPVVDVDLPGLVVGGPVYSPT